MTYRVDNHRATVSFGDASVTEFDRSEEGLVIGLDAGRKITTVTFVDPVKRSASEDVFIKVRYDQDGDALVIDLDEANYFESSETEFGRIIDYNARNEIVGVEFLDATTRFAPETLRELMTAA